MRSAERPGDADARREIIVVAVVKSAELALRGDAGRLQLREIGLVHVGRKKGGEKIGAPGAGAIRGVMQHGIQLVAQAVAERQILAQILNLSCAKKS